MEEIGLLFPMKISSSFLTQPHIYSFFLFIYSSSLDSPGLSIKDVGGSVGMATASIATTSTSTSKGTDSTSIASSITASTNEAVASNSSLPPQLYQSSASSGHSSMLNRDTFWDSDFEAERDTPEWRPKMNQDELGRMKPKEKKRQDVINGKCNTNRLHEAYVTY